MYGIGKIMHGICLKEPDIQDWGNTNQWADESNENRKVKLFDSFLYLKQKIKILWNKKNIIENIKENQNFGIFILKYLC